MWKTKLLRIVLLFNLITLLFYLFSTVSWNAKSAPVVVKICINETNKMTSALVTTKSTNMIEVDGKIYPEVEILESELCNEFCHFDNEKGSDSYIVPNVVHYILFDRTDLQFHTFLSMISVLKIQKPHIIYLHSNTMRMSGYFFDIVLWVCNNTYIDKNRTKQTLIHLQHTEKPTEIFGVKFSWIYHASDVARMLILMKYGGIYLDTDTLVLQPLDKYRKYELSLGWPSGQYLGTQVLIAAKEARFLKLWYKSYQYYNPKLWYYNAGELPTQVILKKYPNIIHRETDVFGVKVLQNSIWTLGSKWKGWKKFYTIHLLIRHKAASQLTLNERTIRTLDCPGGEMARMVLFDIPPTINFDTEIKIK